jgi:GTP-binding protein Era
VAFRAGFVGVVGRPNVGKSTIVNALVGRKVSIVSDKPQTTRFVVRGVANAPGRQIVFVDTPGLHKPRTPLGERLNRRVAEGASNVDAMLLLVDAAAGVGRGDAFVAERELPGFSGPTICAANKIDLLDRGGVARALEAASRLADFDHVVPVSGRTRAGLDELADVLGSFLPEGEPLFTSDQATDLPLETRVEEIVREKALAVAREELPHSIAVRVEEMEVDDDAGLVRISCTVYVERESQKGIVVGKGGATIKGIGTQARAELEPLLGRHVFLDLRVKVLREWQRDPAALDRLGL